MRTLFIALMSIALLSSCGSSTRQAQNQKVETILSVENRNWDEMTVYVVSGTHRVKLGNVQGITEDKFIIPDYLLFGATALRFAADPIGKSRGTISFETYITPGDEVVMVIPNN